MKNFENGKFVDKESHFPIKIKWDNNGKYEEKVCITPYDIPNGKNFRVLETRVKIDLIGGKLN